MRYTGSKNKLKVELLPFINRGLKIFPKGAYIEPFVGGANIISHVKHHTRIGYDANKHLIALFKEAQTNPENLKKAKCFSKEAFKHIKANPDLFYNWYVGAIGFFPTYCNMWMNSYIGHLRPNVFEASKKTLLKQDLSAIHFLHSDYQHIPIGKGNVIYCDPPYKHYDYYKMNFNHLEFAQWVRDASRDNIVFVSEYEMPSDFTCVWKKTIKPGINPKALPREEKLFIYKY